jgi:hypothetical protein
MLAFLYEGGAAWMLLANSEIVEILPPMTLLASPEIRIPPLSKP